MGRPRVLRRCQSRRRGLGWQSVRWYARWTAGRAGGEHGEAGVGGQHDR